VGREAYLLFKKMKWRMIKKIHATFLINLFNKGKVKIIHQKKMKPPHNTYKPDNG
jgi:hypothetical protein